MTTGGRPVMAVFYYTFISCNQNIVSSDSIFDLKTVSLIYFIVSEINILINFVRQYAILTK